MSIPVKKTVNEFREFRLEKIKEFCEKNHKHPKIGFVPTMGALHQGHLSLIKQAKERSDLVFVSIFVNPTQFAPDEDYDAYPRNLEKDMQTILTVGGVDGIFAPEADEMYPKCPKYATFVNVEGADERSEGKSRKGFFRGVVTVVTKLFNIVQPNYSFFGQKDGLQAIIVQQFVRDLNIPVEIIVCPIIREEDGLALSSRNVYLTAEERKIAPVLRKSLLEVENYIKAGKNRNIEDLIKHGSDIINATGKFTIHYFSFADRFTATELEGELKESDLNDGVFISLAATIGKTRLIDNIIVKL